MLCFRSAESDILVKRRLVIVGDGSCGKTSLLTVFTRGVFPEDWGVIQDEYKPTVFNSIVKDMQVNNKEVELMLFDTAGQEEYDRLRYLSYPDSDVILIAYAVDDPESFENIATKWEPEVRKHCPGLPILLVACKTDLRTSLNVKDKPLITDQEGLQKCQEIKANGFVECSAKTGTNVSCVFKLAVESTMESKRQRSWQRSCTIS